MAQEKNILDLSQFGEVSVRGSNGQPLTVHPAANTDMAIGAALEVAELFKRMKDGTTCFMFEKNAPQFVSEPVVVGEYAWENQNKAAQKLNDEKAHGHDDWKPITDRQLRELCLTSVWEKVAPANLQDKAAPCLWSPDGWYDALYGVCHRSGVAAYDVDHIGNRLGVVAVRSGPARS